MPSGNSTKYPTGDVTDVKLTWWWKLANESGMNLLINANEVAGQTVMHFHLHLIPRYSEEDAITIAFNESDKQDLDALCVLLKG